jgi:HEAT repeat protein
VIPTAVLLAALTVLLALLVLLAAAIGARRLVRTVADRRRAGVVAALRPRVAAVVAEALDSLDAPPEPALPEPAPTGPAPPRVAAGPLVQLADGLSRRQRRVLDDIVLSYLRKVRGPARQPLLDLLEHNGTVPRARRRLGRPGLVGRAHAAEILGRSGGPEVVPDLIRLLSDRQAEVRVVAAAGLAGAPPTGQIVRALLAAVESDRRIPAGLLVDTLLRLGPDSTEHLAAALAEGTSHARAVAAEALGLLGTSQASQALLAALGDPQASTEVQVRAAGALGRIGAPAALDPLVGCLRPDRAPALRSAAARALGDLGSPRAVPHLVPLLSGAYQLASIATAALVRMGPAGARELADVAAAEPDTAAGRHAAAGLAALQLAGGQVPVPAAPAPVG